MLYAQSLAEYLPDSRGELYTTIRSDDGRNTKFGDPAGHSAAPKEDHNISAAELLYGVPLALPGELLETLEPPAASFLENLRRCPTQCCGAGAAWSRHF